jgi:hypothetical protein
MKMKLTAVGFGVLGVIVALAGWHLYVDHQNFHALVNMAIQQAAQVKK